MSREGAIAFAVEQYALGELSESRADALREELGADELERRVQAIRSDGAELMARMPPRVFAAAVDTSAPRPSRSRSLAWLAVPLLAAAAVVVVPRLMPPDSEIEVTRQKGVASLHVYRAQTQGPQRLERGDVAGSGDVLQLAYSAAGARYGAIVSQDGNGVLTWHLPRRGDQSIELSTGTVDLDHGYELDDAPDFERFVFVTSDGPFSLSVLEDRLDGWDGGALGLDPTLTATVFDLRKGAQ